MNYNFLYISIAILFIGLISLSGCATTEEPATSGDDDSPTAEADTAAAETETSDEITALLGNNRSQLSDLHISQQHDMPDSFLKKKENNESINNNPEDGYRVQILSTRDVDLADSVAIEFKAWADTTIQGYRAQSYVSFNQPFFRVHVGDFQQRKKANNFSKLVKNKFPDAWVVHDRIEPEEVPADTASFSLISEEDRLKKLDADTLEQP